MKLAKKVNEFIEKYDLLNIKFPLSFLLFFILFKEKFIEILKSILIKPLLSTVKESNSLIDLVILFISFSVLIRFICQGLKGHRVSVLFTSWVVVITIVYSYFRFAYKGFHFIMFKLLPFLALTDSIFIIIVALFFCKTISKNIERQELDEQKGREKNNNGFYIDIPDVLNLEVNDIFNRYPYVVELKDRILSTDTSQTSFAIGIIGKWGSGKSTFIKTIEQEFKKEKGVLQFKFNSWAASNPEKIVELFFSDLSLVLSKYDGALENEILSYAKSLIKSLDNSNLSIIKEVLKKHEDKTFDQQYNLINKSIQRLNKKIIIYIDDVDRLDKKEILEVLRLIRNTASFGNVYFLVAFERDYVIKSISQALISNTDKYLEKIFQLEYYLPVIVQNKTLENFFYKELNNFLDEAGRDIITKMREERQGFLQASEFTPRLDKHLVSLRDAKKLLNIFSLNYEKIRHNIYLPDYLSICLIRLKYPDIYHLLYYKKYDVLTTVEKNGMLEITNGKLTMKFKTQGKSEITDSYLFELIIDKENYILNKYECLSGAKMVNDIFQNHEKHLDNYPTERTLPNCHLSITMSSCFERYFDFSLNGRLDENEFTRALEGDINSFQSKILEWNKHGEINSDLKIKFESKVNFKDREEFEKVVNGIIFFTQLSVPQNPQYNNDFNIDNFLTKIGGIDFLNNTIVKKYYNNDKEEFKKFIKKIFMTERLSPNPDIIFQIADHLLTNDVSNFVLNSEEIRESLKDRFLNLLKNNANSVKELMGFYSSTIKLFNDPTKRNDGIIKPIGDGVLMTEKMREFISTKDIVGFLNYIIYKDQNSRVILYGIINWYDIIFGSLEEFKEVLNASKHYQNEKNEFYNFLGKLGDTRCIEYDFRYLKQET